MELDEIDALLERLGALTGDDEDEGGEDTWRDTGNDVPVPGPEAARGRSWLDDVPATSAAPATTTDPGPAAGGERAPSRSWRVDPTSLLPPLVVPSGYTLDRRGVLRYTVGGDAVPGARLLTLERAWRPLRLDGLVWLPAFLVRTVPELGWVADTEVAAERGPLAVAGRGRDGRSVDAYGVEEEMWDEAAVVPYGVWAPELEPSRMWGVSEVAAALGVAAQTVSTYLARGQMPEPQARVGGVPLWSVPVVWRWHATRPGQGVGGGRRPYGSGTPSAEDTLAWNRPRAS